MVEENEAVAVEIGAGVASDIVKQKVKVVNLSTTWKLCYLI